MRTAPMYEGTAAAAHFSVKKYGMCLGCPGSDFIDEIPDAYKPIDVVMEDARDLVSIEHELRQILNVKGT